MIGIFVAAPWLALVPAVLFGVAYRRWRARAALVAAGAWLAYFLYEEAMRRRILCSGECNIRVDLLLLYPILLLISVVAVRAAYKRRRQRAQGEGG
jgi:hypothetical protein